MAIGPRLDLRQSQSLVMTPQLRQAIKLLQFTNLEVAAFVDEELERNPLLERDETPDIPPERPALDQIVPAATADLPDTAELVASDTLAPDSAQPLDQDYSDSYDAGGPADGGGRGGGADFADDDRGIDDFAAAARTRREHLHEQLRLSFPARVAAWLSARDFL